ncbi:MAG TPA: hypothetical protein PKA64_05145, partial [Myxococcota bacterium]|nr:hypothetical protein [Myxococcota bacterium]
MIRTLRMTVLCGAEHLTEPELRYDLLQRVAETCSGRGLALLAFGLGDEELRLVVEGAAHEVSRAAWRIRIGTSRQIAWRNGTLVWGDDDVREIGDDALDATIAWAHAVHPEDPLATPWTSLRDLLGLRTAAFY